MEECEYLIDLAKPHMKKSKIVDSKTGKSEDSRHTNYCSRTMINKILLEARLKTVNSRLKGKWQQRILQKDIRFLGCEPVQGDALLFWSMKPDATLDLSSLHAMWDVGYEYI
ncbi:2-oxoglutarate (2OG) and Fe(II)-dependent oxygenase superfamily protein isoform 2 [Gossypium australe]|uniref:2-oxoglutarate (2OG) and Fe(II)-dependent oxygenase superfamily protein isoform 2 n=1 Tax=Gossypium australe TaxID=47621 RepID=A0A5B6X316_9ROSI|nr:2-oxoglutarate (2OG) and Fe(II)-dependent oxygenase superfamily protein isoform 2 [Gossypium australe]